MSYKIAQISSYYPQYLRYFTNKHKDNLSALSYGELLALLLQDSFAQSNFYGRALEKFGVESTQIIGNWGILQNKWAASRGFVAKSPQDIVLQQLKEFQPNVIMVLDPFTYGPDFLALLRHHIPSLTLCLGWCSCPVSPSQIAKFKAFDAMLGCTPQFISDFSDAGIRSYQINHAFGASILSRINSSEPVNNDVMFAGSLIPGKGYHNDRRDAVMELINQKVALKIFSEILTEATHRRLTRQVLYDLFSLLERSPLAFLNQNPLSKRVSRWTERPGIDPMLNKLRPFLNPPLFGLDYFQAIHNSSIGFNFHIDVAGKYCGNLRMFEITGIGSCLVTENKENIRDLFEPDREVVTYDSSQEATEKIKWLIQNPAKASEIAKAGHTRTLKDHSYEKRAEQLNDIINLF